MATQAGLLVAAIGTKLATVFPTYEILYGLPDDSAAYIGAGQKIVVRYLEEDAKPMGNQLGGVMDVRPRVSIILRRPYATGGASALATHQATLDLAADLRTAITAMVLANANQSAPIASLGGSLWITDCRTIPSMIDIGTGSYESVGVEFGFRLTRNYGDR